MDNYTVYHIISGIILLTLPPMPLYCQIFGSWIITIATTCCAQQSKVACRTLLTCIVGRSCSPSLAGCRVCMGEALGKGHQAHGLTVGQVEQAAQLGGPLLISNSSQRVIILRKGSRGTPPRNPDFFQPLPLALRCGHMAYFSTPSQLISANSSGTPLWSTGVLFHTQPTVGSCDG